MRPPEEYVPAIERLPNFERGRITYVRLADLQDALPLPTTDSPPLTPQRSTRSSLIEVYRETLRFDFPARASPLIRTARPPLKSIPRQ